MHVLLPKKKIMHVLVWCILFIDSKCGYISFTFMTRWADDRWIMWRATYYLMHHDSSSMHAVYKDRRTPYWTLAEIIDFVERIGHWCGQKHYLTIYYQYRW